MDLWLIGSLLGVGAPAPAGMPQRVSREEWPNLPDDYEQLDRVAQRALYYQGIGPRPETEAQDPGMLAGLGIDPTAASALAAEEPAPFDPTGLAGLIG